MRPAFKKFVSLLLLFGMFALQAHVIFHNHDHSSKAEKGKAHDECQMCATVLAQKAVSPVNIAPLEHVALPFSFVEVPRHDAVVDAAIVVILLRGPPASLFS